MPTGLISVHCKSHDFFFWWMQLIQKTNNTLELWTCYITESFLTSVAQNIMRQRKADRACRSCQLSCLKFLVASLLPPCSVALLLANGWCSKHGLTQRWDEQISTLVVKVWADILSQGWTKICVLNGLAFIESFFFSFSSLKELYTTNQSREFNIFPRNTLWKTTFLLDYTTNFLIHCSLHTVHSNNTMV